MAITLLSISPAQAAGLDRVWREPYGAGELYTTEPTERAAREDNSGGSRW